MRLQYSNHPPIHPTISPRQPSVNSMKMDKYFSSLRTEVFPNTWISLILNRYFQKAASISLEETITNEVKAIQPIHRCLLKHLCSKSKTGNNYADISNPRHCFCQLGVPRGRTEERQKWQPSAPHWTTPGNADLQTPGVRDKKLLIAEISQSLVIVVDCFHLCQKTLQKHSLCP